MSNENDPISRSTIFKAIVTNALAFDRIRLTVASSFLGGSLLFMEKIAPRPSALSLCLLGIGWFLLVVCIGCVAWTQRTELKSGRESLEGRFDEARQIDITASAFSTVGTWTLTIGMLLIMVFGLMNVSSRLG